MKVETTPGEEDRMWFVGIDVSKAALDAAALSNDGEIDQLSVSNTGQGHAELVRWLLRFATNEERLDPDNGLMLAPHVDKLFDEGLITFSDDGTLLISPQLPQATVRKLGLPLTANVGTFHGRKKAYLARHRDGIFEK